MTVIARNQLATNSVQAANDSAAFIRRLKPDVGISEPVYRQLQRQIIGMINSGELQDGDSLPSERTLAEALKLSRTTIRRCYDELRDQDHISTHGRAGAMIKAAPRINPQMDKLRGFTEEMRELGMVPSTRILEQRVVSDRAIASIFNRPSTARFLKLVRLRLADNLPMSREVAWYDLTLAPNLTKYDMSGSVYSFLQTQCGLTLQYGEQSTEAAMSNPDEMECFEFREPGPCLLMKRRTYTNTGQMIEYVEGTFRGDAYTYRITLNVDSNSAS